MYIGLSNSRGTHAREPSCHELTSNGYFGFQGDEVCSHLRGEGWSSLPIPSAAAAGSMGLEAEVS